MTAPAGEVAGIFAGTIGRGGAARSAPVPAKSRASLASTITGGIVMSSAGRYAGGG